MRLTPRLPRRLAAALLVAVAGCDDATAPGGDELGAARVRWAQRGPASYSVTVYRGCECLREMSGPVVVTVVERTVAARAYAEGGAPVGLALAEHFPSVEQLFARIDAARRARVDRLEVTYDPVLGHPVRVLIDPDEVVADDEVTYTVSGLRASS